MDLQLLLPATISQLESSGLLGDYIGGVWGTIIAAVTLTVVFLTWHSARQAEAFNAVLGVLAQMLNTHQSVTHTSGASQFLREFSAIYRIAKRTYPISPWTVEDRIDIAFTYTFYGINTQALSSLEMYGTNEVKAVQDEVARLRDRVSKHNGWFAGHQATYSQYVRNLFAMYTLLDQSRLSNRRKLELGKVIRAKLSNYDQAVLMLNVISHLGREWTSTGISTKYKPFANVPERFFGFDQNFHMKSSFPTVLFEWEKAKGKRPQYWSFGLGKWTFIATNGERAR